MSARTKKLAAGGAVILAALGYLIYSGMSSAVVYFVTPTELVGQGVAAHGRPLRLGGMVERGSLDWNPRTLDLRFRLTDGHTSVPVTHKGTPPDLFGEGQGAVVEGRLQPDGSFVASTIMAKHSEEYMPPRAGEMPVFQKGRYRPAPATAAPQAGPPESAAAAGGAPAAVPAAAPTPAGAGYPVGR